MQPLTMTAQSVLLWLTEHPHVHHPPTEILPKHARSRIHDELINHGLAHDAGSLAFPYAIGINDAGQERAQRLAPTYRRKRMEYRLLQAIQSGIITRSADLPTSDADKPAYTEIELRSATRKLRDKGFVTGPGSWEKDLLRAHLTALGEASLEYDYAHDDYRASAQGTNNAGVNYQYEDHRMTYNHHDHSTHVSNSPGAAVSTGQGNATSVGNTITVANTQAAQLNAIDMFLTALDETPPVPGAEVEHAEMKSAALDLREKIEAGALDGVEDSVKHLSSTAVKAGAYGLLAHLPAITQALGLG